MFTLKNNKNRIFTASIIALATTAVVVVQLPASAEQENPFTDVKPGTSHYDGIVNLYNEGIVTGVTATQYVPNQKATRGEAAQFIANALKLDTQNVTDPGFKDVPKTHKHYGAIAALNKLGIIGGYGDTFKPNNLLARSQIAKMLTLGFDLDVASASTTKFKDVNSIKDIDTRRYIQTLVDYEITVGNSPTTFNPYGKLTRGQLATFLYRALQVTEGTTKNPIELPDEPFEIIGIE